MLYLWIKPTINTFRVFRWWLLFCVVSTAILLTSSTLEHPFSDFSRCLCKGIPYFSIHHCCRGGEWGGPIGFDSISFVSKLKTFPQLFVSRRSKNTKKGFGISPSVDSFHFRFLLPASYLRYLLRTQQNGFSAALFLFSSSANHHKGAHFSPPLSATFSLYTVFCALFKKKSFVPSGHAISSSSACRIFFLLLLFSFCPGSS